MRTNNSAIPYLFAILCLICLGLLSRKITFLPVETGDAIWAMALFCFIRMLFTGWSLNKVAICSLIIAFMVEFSQLIRWEWLNDIRSTFLGHMLLGQGFLWVDLVAYAVGIGLMWVVIGNNRHSS